MPETRFQVFSSEYLGASSERNWLNNVSRPHLSNFKFLQLFMVDGVRPRVFHKSSYIESQNSRFITTSLVFSNHIFTTEKCWITRNLFNPKKMQAWLRRSCDTSSCQTANEIEGWFDKLSFIYEDWRRRERERDIYIYIKQKNRSFGTIGIKNIIRGYTYIYIRYIFMASMHINIKKRYINNKSS